MFGAQREQVVLAQVVTVEQDAAFVRIVEAREQLHERRLAGAVLADQREHLAGMQREVQVAHRPALGARIAEADILEDETRRGSATGTAGHRGGDTISGRISKNENRSSRYSACPATCEKPISRFSSSVRRRRNEPARNVRSPIVNSPCSVRQTMYAYAT